MSRGHKVAYFIRDLEGFRGICKMFRMVPPLEGAYYVAVSSVSRLSFGTSIPYVYLSETYIFPCDENGEVTNWGELEGSMRGTESHEEVLREAGYTIEEPTK